MKLAHLFAAAALSIAAAGAGATTLTQSQLQTSRGQDFSFVFSGLPSNFTGTGILTFFARGDYSPTFSGAAYPAEVLTGSAEGINFGVFGYDDADTSTAYSFDDNAWSTSVALTTAQLTTLLTDGILNVNALLNTNVNLFDPGVAYVGVSFTYAPQTAVVPEPATVGLFGLALAGLAVVRRRKTS